MQPAESVQTWVLLPPERTASDTPCTDAVTRMRDLNQDLSRQRAWKDRKHPASERLHRLQLELPFVVGAAPEPSANDTSNKYADKETAVPKGPHLAPKRAEMLL